MNGLGYTQSGLLKEYKLGFTLVDEVKARDWLGPRGREEVRRRVGTITNTTEWEESAKVDRSGLMTDFCPARREWTKDRTPQVHYSAFVQ
jgi:hypothetical protein